jgi:hypothetical protein
VETQVFFIMATGRFVAYYRPIEATGSTCRIDGLARWAT